VCADARGGVDHEKRALTSLQVARTREEGRGLADSDAVINVTLSLSLAVVVNGAGQIEKQIARRAGRAGIAGEERVLVRYGLGNILVVAEKVGGPALLVRRTVGSRECFLRSLVS